MLKLVMLWNAFWGILEKFGWFAKLTQQFALFFDPAENGKVIKYFNIQRQISKYDMMLTKVKTLFEI